MIVVIILHNFIVEFTPAPEENTCMPTYIFSIFFLSLRHSVVIKVVHDWLSFLASYNCVFFSCRRQTDLFLRFRSLLPDQLTTREADPVYSKPRRNRFLSGSRMLSPGLGRRPDVTPMEFCEGLWTQQDGQHTVYNTPR